MPYMHPRVLDNGLTVLDTEATRLVICSQEPASYTEAITTHMLGYKNGISIGAPEDRTPTGRKVVVGAITDGMVANTGQASHWAIVDTVASRLLATTTVTNPQVVTTGNIFTFAAFDIGIGGPA